MTTARTLTDDERRVWFWQGAPRGSGRDVEEERRTWLLDRWRLDPIAFIVEACRGVPQRYQAQIFLDLADAPIDLYDFYGLDASFPKRQVLVPSGHGMGKTRLLAWSIWWHLMCFQFSYTLCTAPTSAQLTGRLWQELTKVKRRIAKKREWLAAPWIIQSERIIHNNSEFTDWTVAARTARAEQPEALQGAHALDADDEFGELAALFGEKRATGYTGGIMVVAEEASGIDDSIREVLEGALSEPGARLIAPGNPTRPDGWFADGIDQTERYAVHSLDCRQSDRTKVYSIPYRDFGGQVHELHLRGFVDPRYWETILRDCDGDEDRDRFRVRVRGVKPRSATEQVLRTEWVESAMKRQPDMESEHEPVILSVDVGATSDPHALGIRQGFNIRYLDEWLPRNEPNQDQINALNRAIDATETYKPGIAIFDSNGVGRGVAQMYAAIARERGWQVRVIHFIAGERAHDSERYMRRRDEMWMKDMRAWFSNPRCYVPNRPGLRSQLTAPTYWEDTANRIQVESKDDIFKRLGEKGGKSGNMADVIGMSLIPRLHAVPKQEQEATVRKSRAEVCMLRHLERYKQRHEGGSKIFIR